jgi:hypothetical protein
MSNPACPMQGFFVFTSAFPSRQTCYAKAWLPQRACSHGGYGSTLVLTMVSQLSFGTTS